ncbi:hypothetical protein L332_13895 [Agrococcus pavilionensis RW1]|uniref:Uncharacterized protein n=1 Tax=Agrococcus pavilionensis RW1 TaxID=1330458 RepID=U1MU95_9MICO|nr:hypothetical protein L332_13895 [Agrococcus pavilionensis RW1]
MGTDPISAAGPEISGPAAEAGSGSDRGTAPGARASAAELRPRAPTAQRAGARA